MTFLSSWRPPVWAGAIFLVVIQSVFLFSVANSADAMVNGSMIGIYHDPAVRITVVDPRGRRVEGDPRTGPGVKEIETSNYLDESTGEPGTTWAMYIWGESRGRFLVTAIGINLGSFSIDIRTCDERRQCVLKVFECLVKPERAYTYVVDFDPDPGGNNAIREATYDFGGFEKPFGTGFPPVIRRGEVLHVSFKIVRQDARPTEDVTARLLLRPLAEELSLPEEPLHQREPIDLSRAPIFRYNPIQRNYEYDLATEGLSVGSWVLVLFLDDGSVEKAHFELKPGD